MKIDRLIGIITILLQNDKVTAPALARRFEVSKRTINRDIEDICKAGIPVVTTQGYGGGISIGDGDLAELTVSQNAPQLPVCLTSFPLRNNVSLRMI